MSDHLAVLLKRCVRSDYGAFAELYDATSAEVFGLVSHVVRDDDAAADVAREAFTRIWRQASRFDPRMGSGRTWIIATAHQVAVDRARAVSRSDRRARLRANVLAHEAGEAADHPALATLSLAERQAVALAWFESCTAVEVAGILRISVKNARTVIRDGLRVLAEPAAVVPV